MWAHTTTVWINSLHIPTGKQLSGPHVNQGFPPTTQTTTLWAHTTTVWINSHHIPTGKQLSWPHVHQPPPQQHKQPLCGHTQPLCELIAFISLLENNFQGPMLIKGSPPTTQTTTLWAHTTTVWINCPNTPTGQQL